MPMPPRTAAVLLVAVALAAHAQAPVSVYLEDLTSPELVARVAAGATTVIIPAGGTEQNGPHMALGKHNVRVKALSGTIARELGNAMVAPVIAYVPEGGVNPPTGHMRYPGTITVPASTFRSLLESAARSLRLAGFRDIVLLGDSGDYQKDLQAVAAILNREWAHDNARAHAVTEYYRAATVDYARALRARGYTDAEIGPHAGLADTALLLAIAPRLVRADKLDPAHAGAKLPGVAGDPRRATPELGRLGVDGIVARSVAAIRAAVASH
ncbi:MAG: creatininase family protein [Burkholderiales bacterium]|nr:creatininase family protein [Burkholderiales bacterium]